MVARQPNPRGRGGKDDRWAELRREKEATRCATLAVKTNNDTEEDRAVLGMAKGGAIPYKEEGDPTVW